MGRPAARATAAAVGFALALVTGCSSSSGGDSLPTIDPATPAVAPEPAVPPAGTVQALGRAVEALAVDPGTSTVAALAGDGSRLLLLRAADPAAAPREVTLPAAAATVLAGVDGEVLAPGAGVVTRVDVRSGAVTEVPVDGDARAAAVLADGRLAVGTADGVTHLVDPASGATQTVPGLASVDALAAVGTELAALDRRQTSLTEVDVADGDLGLALRAGEGATQLATDPLGRVLVTDTRGGELHVYTLDPLVLRQRYPVPNAPYGVAYDSANDLVWVTSTGSNEVVGYDLSTGIPQERGRYATVRQPNSVVVDTAGAVLVIGSGTGDGLQRIPIGGV
ncbi:hypothetical protein LZP97_07630 [Rhodococcus sp. DMF-1]|uniref:lipoprotein n=1 Tax=Rhodococcus TaxID=1827 RepID=UPI000660D1AB|nr:MULTISPECIES: lipoprotein [Rhodococcus]MBP2211679.1 outer membrane protein assembly factor BamB [Rhodococcus ruber]MCZ1073506.1 hypothetical protein [Rhodococcus sp. A5(2022)]UIR38381.1 hypothetical protein LZP97_07630 [Rhodococcus sp. DMF-1]